MVVLDFLLGRIESPILFALQMWCTAALYGFFLPRRNGFLLRLAGGTAVYLLAAVWVPNWRFLGLFYLPPLAVFALLLLLARLVFDVPWKMVLFFGVAVYATEHMAVALNDAIHAALPIGPDSPWWGGTLWISFGIVFLLCWLLFVRRTRGLTTEKMQSNKLISIAALIFLFVYILRILCVSELDLLPVGNSLRIAGHLYSLAGCFVSLWILFSANHEDSLQAENRMIEQLLRERETQQRFTSEAMELVNIKSHDMKRQISLLRSTLNGGNSEAVLDDMERAVTLYDSIAETGNPVMDTLLTEKGLYCEQHRIRLNCMVDGEQLSFLSSSDLCALFGNLLENAIEAVEGEPEEKRIISLQVFRKRGYLCIHAENYCAKAPQLKDGLPQTTKQDRDYHGFGVKSIQYIVRKYGGNLTISTPPGLFCADILIPPPESGR